MKYRDNSKKLEWLLYLLFAWIIFLHLFRLIKAGPMWRDEISSIYVATAPSLKCLYNAQAYDSFPLLNALILRLWITIFGIGTNVSSANDFYIRIYGFLCGLALISALIWTCVRAFKSKPIFSIILFALSPAVIIWGDSIRAYGLGTAMIIIFMGLLWRLIISPSILNFYLTATFGILSVWTLYGNAFLVLSICGAGMLLSIIQKRNSIALKILLIGLISALSLLLNLTTFKKLVLFSKSVNQYITIDCIMRSSWNFITVFGVIYGYMFILALIISIIICISIICKKKEKDLNSENDSLFTFILLTLIFSILTFTLYLHIIGIPPQNWYFIPIAAVIVSLIDGSLRSLYSDKCINKIIFLIIIISTILFGPSSLQMLAVRMTNVDQVAENIQTHATKKDLILLNDPYQASTFVRYYHGAGDVQVWPPCSPDLLKSQALNPILNATYSKNDAIAPLLQNCNKTLSIGGKVWLVGAPTAVPIDSPPHMLNPGLYFQMNGN